MRWALRGAEQGLCLLCSFATQSCTFRIHSPPVTPRVWENHTWHGHAEALGAFEPLLLFALWVFALVPVCFGALLKGWVVCWRSLGCMCSLTYQYFLLHPEQPSHLDPIHKRTYLASMCASKHACKYACMCELICGLDVPKKKRHLRRL